MDNEVIIGLEIHAQLLTRSKMFCPCSTEYANTPPNTHVCPICLGMPGVLPTINKKAIEFALMTALALNCSIPESTKFDRKNYPYPDLVKGYQISQYDSPLSRDGWLDIETDGQARRIGITRVHLEEDTAKLIHCTKKGEESYSLVDANRAGVPLMEIVSQPDLRFPEEARQFMSKLWTIIRYLGVSSGNMEEGSFRCDANISVRPKGSSALMPKVEVKNMNSFKAVHQALEYEAGRQNKVLAKGGKIVQETRGWHEEQGITVTQRTKEYAHDYRYFPEPDLPPLTFHHKWVESLRSRLPELPDAMRQRFTGQYGLSPYDAKLLTNSRALALYFEECLQLTTDSPQSQDIQKKAKVVANWLNGDFSRLLNAAGVEINAQKITPQQLTDLCALIDKGILAGPAAKKVFEEMFHTGRNAADIVAESDLGQIDDIAEVKQIVREVLSVNKQAIADFHDGKQQALTFLIGQAMRTSRGRANPQEVKQYFQEELGVK